MTKYAELYTTSPYSFLEGASHADDLMAMAAARNVQALAITDRNTLAGVVRGHVAAKALNMRYIPGCRLVLEDGLSLLAWPTNRSAYGTLSQMLTRGNRRTEKGHCSLYREDLDDLGADTLLALLPDASVTDQCVAQLHERWAGLHYLALSPRYDGRDRRRIQMGAVTAQRTGLALLAVGDVRYHRPERKALHDVMTCVRNHVTLDSAGDILAQNGEHYIRPGYEMARIFKDAPDAVHRTLDIMNACHFSLDELAYNYPSEPVPLGDTPQSRLVSLTRAGSRWRFPQGMPDTVQKTVDHELKLIEELGYAPYFLTVHDIVQFARSRGILCQGRGSAANSVVCFLLGITSVNPTQIGLLFERFVSAERGEPPDIDVDFEHSRREEVIQYIYARYGRHRAALAATVIRYRAKSAARDVGKVMGLSEDMITALTGTVWGSYGGEIEDARVRESGVDPDAPRVRETLTLASELMGFPRHLSQHVGGFVLTETPLDHVVPIQNAAMADRTVIEWDKNDIDALGILKVDILALGMLTALRGCFDMARQHYGLIHTLATLPREDEATYAMLRRADSVGVFQVESRAQMSMLPRLKPRAFYDLVVQVAIVRPGPIQGDMVHPYLRRRQGLEPVSFPAPDPAHGPPDELEGVLANTYGVPLFQEQAMKIAIVAAGFSPGEADGLRRAMASFRNTGTIDRFKDRFTSGMIARGYETEFAERCFQQIEGFADYGFPESHAASFALLVEASSWFKCHYPDIFLCALLNAQPMGFYAPAQLVRDAREHGVCVLPVDINGSDWDNKLEPTQGGSHGYAVRLGFRQVKGLREDAMGALVDARIRPYTDAEDLMNRSGMARAQIEILAEADAFRSVNADRRQALWQVRGLVDAPDLPLFSTSGAPDTGTEDAVHLPEMALGEHVVSDYQTLRLSLKAHPMALLRSLFNARGVIPTRALGSLKDGSDAHVAGLVLVRQRPGSAKGVLFLTLEDESGVANIVVWAKTFEAHRRVIMASRLVAAKGKVQIEDGVIHLVARTLTDASADLLRLSDERFAPGLAHADEVKSGADDARTRSTATPAPDPGLLPPFRARRHPRMVTNMVPRSRDFH